MIKILFILFFPLYLLSKYQVVTYFPLESHLVKKIGQDEVKIREIYHRFSPDFKELPYSEVSRLSNAKIYFHFGMDIENQYAEILKRKNSDLMIVDISSNILKIDKNPYIWMDPLVLRDVAKNIYESLIKIDRYKTEYYKKNYERFLDEIDTTFLKIKRKITNSEINAIYVFDDYWEYFAKRFRIKTIKKEKKFLSVNEVQDLLLYTQKKNIKKVLYFDNIDYNVALSLGSNLNLQIVEDDIFQENWQLNLLNLSDNLLK